MVFGNRHFRRDQNARGDHQSSDDFDEDNTNTLHATSELSNQQSELARFLLIGDDASHNGDNNNTERLGTSRAFVYAMTMEPIELRSEKAIMLSEAFAIFGALYLGGSWVIYEWGSGQTEHVIVSRVFEAMMAISLSVNILLAMIGSLL